MTTCINAPALDRSSRCQGTGKVLTSAHLAKRASRCPLLIMNGTPATDRSRNRDRTTMILAHCHRSIGACGRWCRLTTLVIASASQRAVGPNAAGMVDASADLCKGACEWCCLGVAIAAPAVICPIGLDRAIVIRANAKRSERATLESHLTKIIAAPADHRAVVALPDRTYYRPSMTQSHQAASRSHARAWCSPCCA